MHFCDGNKTADFAAFDYMLVVFNPANQENKSGTDLRELAHSHLHVKSMFANHKDRRSVYDACPTSINSRAWKAIDDYGIRNARSSDAFTQHL